MTGQNETREYKIIMNNRKNIMVEGVQNVETFDEEEIIMDTRMGVLVLKGQNLHVVQLNLEEEVLIADGICKSLEFSDDRKGIKGKGMGFIQRILK